MTISPKSLELAIDLEKEGHEYYMEQSKDPENPMVEKVLKSLASQELDHIEVIKNIAEGKQVSAEDLPEVNMEEQVKKVFEEFSEAEKENWKVERTSVYEHALELEEKLHDLYKDLAEDTDDKEEEEFFRAIMAEENKHWESIQNVIYYITDHDRWMAEEEGKVWGWMNV